MNTSAQVDIRLGGQEQHRDAIARLYLYALHEKIAPFLGTGEKAERLLSESLNLDRVLVALQGGRLLGVAGFEQNGRGVFSPKLASMYRIFGWSGCVRLLAMAMLDRSKSSDTLLMDGLAVVNEARGKGIGTLLLAAVEDHARRLGKQGVRLDVIDTNPLARRLYERRGYRSVQTRAVGLFRFLFSFAAATEMRKDLAA
ncbi:MAG: GNAT family N-acetyltransferase [Hyphomicrobiales bacterium]|nr:GNAT family N-acetyltransferase [Hyphomicrobiales bacterium]MCY4039513.1 GNAT family N-acetyltransferase [Hyphomicrobiales bacterium]